MAKKIQSGTTPLDAEIERFLMRIGDEGGPLNYVTSYGVQRSIGEPHRIMIEFVADARFDAASELAPSEKS